MPGRKRANIEGIEPGPPRLALGRELPVRVHGNAFGWLRWRGGPERARFVFGHFVETFWIDPSRPGAYFELWSLTGREIHRVERAGVLSLPDARGSFTCTTAGRVPRFAYHAPRVTLSAEDWPAIFERHSPRAATP